MSVRHGDLFDVLPTLEAESFHACVTDPPYGIGFMGKEWDVFKPSTVSAMRTRTVKDHKTTTNPNLRGRKAFMCAAPVEYDFSGSGNRAFQQWNEQWAREVHRLLKPGAYILVCGAPRSYHRMACGLEDAGFEIRDCFAWLFGQGFPKSLNFEDGWGTALKPANEPIVIARKPFKGSVEANRAQHGTGGINIEACRLDSTVRPLIESDRRNGGNNTYGDGLGGSRNTGVTDLGRWPSNVLLDEIAAGMLDEAVGELVSGGTPAVRYADKFRNAYGDFKGGASESGIGSSAGGPSRFFYVAKPDRQERDRGCEGLKARPRDESRQEGLPGGDNPRNRGLQPRGNHHPTVKPVDLMRWLVRLVTPKGGRVLDPFCGSGTTGMACEYEGFEFLGIEKEAAYVEIAERRIADVMPLLRQA